MVQLSLLAQGLERTLGDELRVCAAEAGRRRVAETSWIEEATRATAVRFRAWTGVPLDESQRVRVRAYFDAVLRRRVLAGRDSAAREARRLLVARSIQADLMAAGWDRERAADEARRILGEHGREGPVA